MIYIDNVVIKTPIATIIGKWTVIKRRHGSSGNKSNMGNLHMFQNPIWKPMVCSCGLLLLFKEI